MSPPLDAYRPVNIGQSAFAVCNQAKGVLGDFLPGGIKAPWPALNAEQSHQVQSLLTRFSSVFSKDEGDFGCTDLVQHEIPVLDTVPVRQRYRRLPPSQYEQVKAHTVRAKTSSSQLQSIFFTYSGCTEKGWWHTTLCKL